MHPPFFSCDDLPKYSNATPRPYISSSWIGHKPLTPLATSILLQPSPDMVFPLFSSKQAMMSLYQNAKFFVTDPTGDSSSFLLSRGIRQGCPLSPYLFIIALSALTTDLHSFFQEIFSYTPWTYSFTHTLTDAEYADDTVLIARTNDTLCRLAHLFQHLAARTGLLLNGSKCQLLTVHAVLPVSLSLTADADSQCNCPYCAPFFFTTPTFHLLMFHSPHSPVPNTSVPSSLLPHRPFRTSTFVVLKPPPPSRHSIHSFDILLFLSDSSSGSIPKSSSPSFSTAQNPKSTPQHKLQKLTASTIKHFAKISKLRVPTTIVSTLLIHLILILPAPMNSSFHLHILSFHRAFSSMRISDSRIKYLGHILRHHDSAESFIMFNPSHPLRTISSPFRRGA